MSERDILTIISEDVWMMEVLRVVQEERLPDWWVGAGFVRNKVWDTLHEYSDRTPLNDIDVIYFDAQEVQEEREKEKEQKMMEKMRAPWSVKNQARMASVRGESQYRDTEDALSRWVETATCVGVRLDGSGKLVLSAPHGIYDLTHLILRKNPQFHTNDVFYERIKDKNWLTLWPKLKII